MVRTPREPTGDASGDQAPQTPERSYEVGNGAILSHFESLASPDSSIHAQQPQMRVQWRQIDEPTRRRPNRDQRGEVMSTLNCAAHVVESSGSEFAEDETNDNQPMSEDMDMSQDNATGINGNGTDVWSSNQGSAENRLLSRAEKLAQWRVNKGESKNQSAAGTRATSSNRAGPISRPSRAIDDTKSYDQSMLSASQASESNQDSNEVETNTTVSSTSFDISPPRRHGSTRISTAGLDLTTTSRLNRSNEKKRQSSYGGPNGTQQRSWKETSALDASYVSDSYSPMSSIAFLGRDEEEDERALNAKSDKERAFLYKKRYVDTYGMVASLAQRVMKLEQLRTDKNTKIDILREQITMQEKTIQAMNERPVGSNVQEKKLQSLCREVGALVQQLKERDAVIDELYNERDVSSRTLSDLMKLKTSGQSSQCDACFDGRKANNAAIQQASATAHQLQEKLDETLTEKVQIMNRVLELESRMAELHNQYEECDSQRVDLAKQLQTVQDEHSSRSSDWASEKSRLVKSASESSQLVAQLTSQIAQLRSECTSFKNLLDVASRNERKYMSMLEVQQQRAKESEARMVQLKTQLGDAHLQLNALSNKAETIKHLETTLANTRSMLDASELNVTNLQEQLHLKEIETRNLQVSFRERMGMLENRIYQAEIVRRSLHNKVMELKGNIRVFCRVRPILAHEASSTDQREIFQFPDYYGERRQIELQANPKSHVSYGQNGSKDTVKKYNFDFDLVFNNQCSQEDVFLEVSALVQSALDGFNVCIFAYGQTGSGKTYTMQGREDCPEFSQIKHSSDMGIVGRSIAHIYASIADLRSTTGWEFGVTLEMIEIYNDTLRDLLAPVGSTEKVDIRMDADGKPTVMNSCIHKVEDEQAAWRLLQKAMSRRATKSTNMNDRSSRSHCVITFRLSGVNPLTGAERSGVVHLVDLAGSERVSKSGSDQNKDLMKEALAINKSLSALGNVICALAKKSGHVPFRDSKLTHLLRPSLGGDSKTLMICNLSPLPQHREETLNSLRFAKTVNSCEVALPTYSSRS